MLPPDGVLPPDAVLPTRGSESADANAPHETSIRAKIAKVNSIHIFVFILLVICAATRCCAP